MSERRYRIVVQEPLSAQAAAALAPEAVTRGDGVVVLAGHVTSGAEIAPLVRQVLELGLTLVAVETAALTAPPSPG